MEKKERNFVESPKMKKFWEDLTFQYLKHSWDNGYQDQISFFKFVRRSYENVWRDWDDAGATGLSDENLVLIFTDYYPIISQMYNEWGYEIEFAIVEYMDILRGIKEGLEEGRLTETKTTIKRILNENKVDRFTKIAVSHLIDKFSTNKYGTKVEYRTLLVWKENYVDTYLKDVFGLTEKDTKEIYDTIINEWLSELTGLPKVGTRVKLVKMDDPYTLLTPGDEGIITAYNNTPWGPQLSVNWDMGSTLDLVPKEDEWEVLSN